MYVGTLPEVVNEGVVQGIKNVGSAIGKKVDKGLGKLGAYWGKGAGEDHADMEMGVSDNSILNNFSDSYHKGYMNAYNAAYKKRKKEIKDDRRKENKDWAEYKKTKQYKNSPAARLTRAADAFKKTY